MKILNLYAGIGGNRKLWGDEHEITAVEYDEETAKVYKDYFPNDTIIIDDAHQYLLYHYKEFDFIWSSPPCPTHSRINTTRNGQGYKMRYPEMKLYEEIIFLKHWFKGKYVVENVVPYYEALIGPTKRLDRHFWWANFHIADLKIRRPFKMDTATIKDYEDFLGFDLSKYKLNNKTKNLRNCVIPETGKHILDCAVGSLTNRKDNQERLF